MREKGILLTFCFSATPRRAAAPLDRDHRKEKALFNSKNLNKRGPSLSLSLGYLVLLFLRLERSGGGGGVEGVVANLQLVLAGHKFSFASETFFFIFSCFWSKQATPPRSKRFAKRTAWTCKKWNPEVWLSWSSRRRKCLRRCST